MAGQQIGPGRTCVTKAGRAGLASNLTPGAEAQEQRGGRHGCVGYDERAESVVATLLPCSLKVEVVRPRMAFT